MKRWTSGQVLGVVGLVAFIAGIAIKADSAADWAIGLGLLVGALLVGWWLTRFDRPTAGNVSNEIAAPRLGAPPANGGTFPCVQAAAHGRRRPSFVPNAASLSS